MPALPLMMFIVAVGALLFGALGREPRTWPQALVVSFVIVASLCIGIGYVVVMHASNPPTGRRETRSAPTETVAPQPSPRPVLDVDAYSRSSQDSAVIGDVWSYELTVKNTSESPLDDVFLSAVLPSGGTSDVLYVPGSTTVDKGPIHASGVTDAWLQDGFNGGQLKPGQSINLAFEVKLAKASPAGERLQFVGEFSAKGYDWKQCAAFVTVPPTRTAYARFAARP